MMTTDLNTRSIPFLTQAARLSVSLAIALATGLAGATTTAAATEEVTCVGEVNGEASVTIPGASVQDAAAVYTHYEVQKDRLPNIKDSRVLEGGNSRCTLIQLEVQALLNERSKLWQKISRRSNGDITLDYVSAGETRFTTCTGGKTRFTATDDGGVRISQTVSLTPQGVASLGNRVNNARVSQEAQASLEGFKTAILAGVSTEEIRVLNQRLRNTVVNDLICPHYGEAR